MARPGITALIPTFGADVVAIFKDTEDGEPVQILKDAHLMQVSVEENAIFFKHPLESSRSLVDHRVIQPVAIEFRIILTESASILGALVRGSLDFEKTVQDIYSEMRQLFITGELLLIQTKTSIYPRQVFQSMPHEEPASMFNGVIISARSSEIQVESARGVFGPEDETDTNTTDRGKLNALELPSGLPGLASVGSIFGV